MRKLITGSMVLALVGAGVFYGLTAPAAYQLVRGETIVPSNHAVDIDNGRILFFAGGCSSCHATPNQPDGTRLGGGYSLGTPFGTFSVPNISPHERDGIGAWGVADFVRAMREGVSPQGQHYYPAFPYTSYQRMSAADLIDLFGFLKTLPAVEGRAPDHDLPFPFNIRRSVGLWKLAFLDGRAFVPDASKSPSWNRGAYLVQGAGHCAECHSERNAVGAIIRERRYAGGPNPEGRGVAPNITPHPTGVAGWSVADLALMLKTGETPNFVNVSGPMVPVVRNTARLPDEDRAAIGEYLLSLPPREGRTKPQ